MKYMVFDTETTGLNIGADKPFLFQYGLVDEKLVLHDVIVFYANDKKSLDTFIGWMKIVMVLVGHNIKFDTNMALNLGLDPELFEDKRYIDTAVLARLVISHDIQKDKAFRIQLKQLALRYLREDSIEEERKLKQELSQLTIAHKNQMKEYFIKKGILDPKMKSTQQTKVINHIYNNWWKTFHLYPQFVDARREFFAKNPAPTYADCSNVYKYGETDVYLTYGLFKLWYPQVVKKDQVPTLLRIDRATYPLAMMEREGLVIDVQRVLRDRREIVKEIERVKIIDPRTGAELKIGQHAKLKELYEYESGMSLKSADKETRAEIESKSPAARSANYLAKMDKYLSTYITGILKKITPVGNEYRVYTQYNLAGTITGRLSSDFQQFPRDPLVLQSGYEVNIRSWFVVPQDYKYMFYFDYSQMELRLQCEWTNIVNGQPDKNMARAFMPYACVKFDPITNDMYTFANDSDWEDWDWFLEEDTTIQWEPTDLHGLTTKNAFPGVDEMHPDWKHYRSLGKRTNFAVNYGANAARIQQALKVTFPEAQALVDGYKKAFQGVVKFNKWLQNRTYTTPSTPNLLLRRYYSRNKHLLQNWLVQGSGADILLEKTREVYDYIKDKPHWKLMISVHDELGLLCEDIPRDQLNKEAKEIQAIMTYHLTAVDITVDIEYTETCWSEKKEW